MYDKYKMTGDGVMRGEKCLLNPLKRTPYLIGLFVILFFVIGLSTTKVKAETIRGTGARSCTSVSGDVFLGGKYIEVGISEEGSFGTVERAPLYSSPGIDAVKGDKIYFHPDTSGGNRIGMVSNASETGEESGWNSETSDFFLPAAINEAWLLGWQNGLRARGSTISTNDSYASHGIASVSTVNKSTMYLLCAETTIMTVHDIKIVQRVFFEPDDKNFQTSVEITNLCGMDIEHMRFMRTFDPDHGVKMTSSPITHNVIGNEQLDAKGVSVTAYTTEDKAPFIYFSDDPRATAGWGGFWIASPFEVTEPGNNRYSIKKGAECKQDYNVFIYYDIPLLKNGETTKLNYFSSLDTNLDSAIDSIMSLDVTIDDVEVEILNDPSQSVKGKVNASITGVDPSTCTTTYQWYRRVDPLLEEDDILLEGETNEIYTFVPTGKIEDAGEYHVYCQVTADNGEQKVIKKSKDLIIHVYNLVDLSYDSNGGSGSIEGLQDIRGGQMVDVANSESLTAPTGYHFKEWNTEPDGSGISYLENEKIVLAKDTVLYAQWEKDKISVRLNAYLDDIELKDNDRYEYYVVLKETGDEQAFIYDEDCWKVEVLPSKIYGLFVKTSDTKEKVYETEFESAEEISKEVRFYTVKWDIDADGNADEEEILKKEDIPLHEDVKKDATAEYTYTFKEWTPSLAPVTEEVTYTAVFDKEKNKYEISFDTDGDGTVDEKQMLEYGEVPKPKDGVREDTKQYAYTFTGWDKEFVPVTEETTYTAQFSQDVKKYMISWDVNGDGVEDAAELIDYGEVPKRPDVDKAADYQYTYRFIGWTPKIEAVSEDKLYTAVFELTKNTYKVNLPRTQIGYQIVPEPGNNQIVPYNGTYAFRIKNKPGYDISTIVVTANGVPIKPVKNVYTISNIGVNGQNIQLAASIKDKFAPTGKITIGSDDYTTLLDEITFDKFYKQAQKVQIFAQDVGSGIQSISYHVTQKSIADDELKKIQWQPYKASFYLYPDSRNIVYAKLVDKEGNTTYLSSCGVVLEAPYDKNDIWKYADVTAVTEYITTKNTDKDIKGSIYNRVRARLISNKKKTQTIKWNQVKDADGYIIYGNKCGLIYKMKKLKTIKNPKKTKWVRKKLKPGKYYKYIVVAYKNIDGRPKVLSVSKGIHATTAGGKYKNPKAVKLKKKKITLRVGKKYKIKAKRIMPKGGKMREHVNRFRFETTDKKIAVVNKKSVITAKKAGKCYIFVYIQNGIYKMIELNVVDNK